MSHETDAEYIARIEDDREQAHHAYVQMRAERDQLRAIFEADPNRLRAMVDELETERDDLLVVQAERDRLRVLVEAAQRWYKASDLEELQHAVGGLKAAVRQLDGDDHGSGPTGGVADDVRGVDGGAGVAPASPVAGDEDGHTNQGVGKQYMSNACIHDKHDVCDEECPYCHDGCACSCHPWNETTMGGMNAGDNQSEDREAAGEDPVVGGASGVPDDDGNDTGRAAVVGQPGIVAAEREGRSLVARVEMLDAEMERQTYGDAGEVER